MAAYYKRIKGQNYDKEIIDLLDELSGPEKKKKINLSGAKKITALVSDGGKITDVEKRTVSYILENYTFLESAIRHIEQFNKENLIEKQTISESPKKVTTGKKINSASKKFREEDKTEDSLDRNEAEVVQDYSFMQKEPNASGAGVKKIIILMLLLACLGAIIFAYLKISDGDGPVERKNIDQSHEEQSQNKVEVNEENLAQTNNGEADPLEKDKKEVDKSVEPEKKEKDTEPELTSKQEEKSNSQVYIIQPGDTLVSISYKKYGVYKKWRSIYRLNKKRLKSPSKIFPGHKIYLPEE